jgi:hypothetical protein
VRGTNLENYELNPPGAVATGFTVNFSYRNGNISGYVLRGNNVRGNPSPFNVTTGLNVQTLNDHDTVSPAGATLSIEVQQLYEIWNTYT